MYILLTAGGSVSQHLHKSLFALRRWDLKEDKRWEVWEGKGKRKGGWWKVLVDQRK